MIVCNFACSVPGIGSDHDQNLHILRMMKVQVDQCLLLLSSEEVFEKPPCQAAYKF